MLRRILLVVLASLSLLAGCKNKTPCHLLPGGHCAKAKFIEKSLRAMNLKKLTLSDASLDHTDFTRSDLSHANLSGSKMVQANFENTKLMGADLSKVKANGASFRGADLTGANLSGAVLDGADFSGAKLGKVDMSGAEIHGADFSRATLDGVNMKGAKFGTCVMHQSHWKNVTCPDGKPMPASAKSCATND